MQQTVLSPTQLGQLLRSARRAKKLSQSDAASRVGLSQSRLSALELTPKSITLEQLFPLLALYGLELQVQSKGAGLPSKGTEW